MKSRLTLIAILSVLAVSLVGCGSSNSSSSTAGGSGSSTSTTHFAKTKFILHAGLAFGAFHRWIYKPAKAGELSHPFRHPLVATKAALAAAFTYHELKLALADAQADPTLSKIVAPITALENKIHGVEGGVKSGGTSASQATGLDGAVSSIKGQAASDGQPITEQTPASP
ncbi:MAG: hypothetical protein JO027_15890 [Solirubrobacterales bacterium]|nr:hypothetical protein [Solirubrobacterales bacterium]